MSCYISHLSIISYRSYNHHTCTISYKCSTKYHIYLFRWYWFKFFYTVFCLDFFHADNSVAFFRYIVRFTC